MQVLSIEQSFQIVVRLPLELVTDEYIAQINTESGESLQHRFIPIDGQLINVEHIEEIEFQEYIIDIPIKLTMGYHSLTLVIDEDVLGNMRLIAAPFTCYQLPFHPKDERKWGVKVQLSNLSSEQNWGIGDFSDLSLMLEKLAKQGAQFVKLDSISANVSVSQPQLDIPSAGYGINFVYLDVTAIAGFENKETQVIVNNHDFKQSLQQVRAADKADVETIASLKLKVLSAIFDYQNDSYFSKKTKHHKAFKRFISEGGENLQALAVFAALQEYFANQGSPCLGCSDFPEEYADFQNSVVKKFAKKHHARVTFFQWLQWQASLQLDQANQLALKSGMSIGVIREITLAGGLNGADYWGNKELYCSAVNIGFPPSENHPEGKRFTLTPFNPEKLFELQYQPFIDLLRATMQSSGALQINHVMTLLKQWWIAKEDDPNNGGFVHYPVDDLLAILVLESHRNRKLIVAHGLQCAPEQLKDICLDKEFYRYSSNPNTQDDTIESHVLYLVDQAC